VDVGRLDLIRDTALDRAEATSLLQAAEREIIIAFLAGLAVAVTGLALPLAYYLNKRFGSSDPSHYLVIFRQSMWVGAWFAFCTWLQMNRSLGWGVALLVAAVLAIFELLLQVRERAATVSE
jgi:Mg/Co/Ni transporter MgtE